MAGYILSILGKVIAGIIIDIIVPSGNINKYIKSIYAIFVVAVILSPLINYLNKEHDLSLHYEDYQVSEQLLNYISKQKVSSLELQIENSLNEEGFSNVDIKINYSIENNELSINSCTVNLQNLVIVADKQHINKYEIIKQIVRENTNLTDEEMIFYE